MTNELLKSRRFTKWQIVVVAAIAAITAFSLGYRHWAYNGWIEDHLVCINSDAEFYEIDRLPTPELQDIIEDYENGILRRYSEVDRPFYREGSRFYMRPWYYINDFTINIKGTLLMTSKTLGGKYADYEVNELVACIVRL